MGDERVTEETDWEDLRTLAREVEEGASLELTDERCALLLRTAQQVAISQQDAEDALRGLSTATSLLQEIRRRIREGSRRRGDALDRVCPLQEKGDYTGAQQVMRDVLTVEVVPLYRAQAQITLEKLAALAEVCATGRVNPDRHDREQLAALSHRLQQGYGLDLTDDLRALLRRTALTAAVSETETEEALKSPEGAEALMQRVLSRFRDGERRFLRAMYRMTSLRDAGDVEGARQQMRDVLTVEVVPLYREMAEEQLRGLDSPPPGS
jgi:DUSAM domain-containing protein